MVPVETTNEEELRGRILQQARNRFLDEGFVSVSVEDLCGDLGISKKTFYRIFPSKDTLLHQEADWMMGEARRFVTGLLESDQGFVEKALALSTGIATNASKVSRTLIRDIQRHAPDIWKRLEEFRLKTLQTSFSRLIEQGVKEGYVRTDLNTRVFMLAYIAAISQVMTPSVLAVEAFSPTEAIRDIFGMFFQGVLTEKGRALIVPFDQIPITRNR